MASEAQQSPYVNQRRVRPKLVEAHRHGASNHIHERPSPSAPARKASQFHDSPSLEAYESDIRFWPRADVYPPIPVLRTCLYKAHYLRLLKYSDVRLPISLRMAARTCKVLA